MNEKAYTLIEALFQVVVFTVLSHIFILIMLWYAEMKTTMFAVEQSNWELFVYDINTYFLDVLSFEVSDKHDKITFETPGSLYSIEYYQTIIRKQVNHQGHEPLLIGVRTCKFDYQNGELTIAVEFLNGIKKERTYYVPIHKK